MFTSVLFVVVIIKYVLVGWERENNLLLLRKRHHSLEAKSIIVSVTFDTFDKLKSGNHSVCDVVHLIQFFYFTFFILF